MLLTFCTIPKLFDFPLQPTAKFGQALFWRMVPKCQPTYLTIYIEKKHCLLAVGRDSASGASGEPRLGILQVVDVGVPRASTGKIRQKENLGIKNSKKKCLGKFSVTWREKK